MNVLNLSMDILGRVLLGLYFLVPGISKIGGFEKMVAYMTQHGVPLVKPLLVLTIALQVGGGLALIADEGRLRWPLTRRASAGACRDSGQGRGRADSGCGQGYLRPAGAPAGLAGGRVCRARPVDARLGLTLRPVT